jgi:DNA-directed RNA polymerase subunit RPC12/RpoP
MADDGGRGVRVALLTQHGKERAIAPVLAAALGWRIERVEGFDTDRLGTFTREVARTGTQLDAARRKARIGMALSGLPRGLGSEGSFGPDPGSGLLPWNVELLVYLDDALGIELVGLAQGPAASGQRSADDWAAVEAFARDVGFPGHQLVLRPSGPDDARIRKGLADWPALQAAWASAAAEAADGRVCVEVDLRAHANPTRMATIARAAEDLARKLQSRCPACGAPGYAVVERVAGLPCADCGAPTRETRAEVYACLRCPQRETRARSDREYADPARCDHCNP